MLHLSQEPACESWRDGRSAGDDEPIVRAVRIGLMIYLAPVLIVVTTIGIASLAFQAAGRLIRKPKPALAASGQDSGGRIGRRSEPGRDRRRISAAR